MINLQYPIILWHHHPSRYFVGFHSSIATPLIALLPSKRNNLGRPFSTKNCPHAELVTSYEVYNLQGELFMNTITSSMIHISFLSPHFYVA